MILPTKALSSALLSALVNLDEVVTELSLDRTLNRGAAKRRCLVKLCAEEQQA